MKININTATWQELQEALGVGPNRCKAIVRCREEHGLYRDGSDLLKARMIGSVLAARIAGMVEFGEEWKLYTEYRDGKPSRYRYGPEWQAMALYVDGGYKTPEEAKLAWLREWEAQK